MKITENFVKYVLNNDGFIFPLVIDSQHTGGTGLMNPSVYNDNGTLCVILRHVNYTFYHSESKLFQHQWGPLTYVHPENDMHLRTRNFYLEYDSAMQPTRTNEVDMTAFDTYEPQWDFVGLEDARLFRWNGDLYISGVRRDTTTNGQGRMELSKLVKDEAGESIKEVSRFRIPPPIHKDSYCEKNWMPVIDMPFHYVKWSDPTEVVSVGPETESSTQIFHGEKNHVPRDPRGSSQVIPFGDGRLAVTHEVVLFNSEAGRKDAVYRHRFLYWDKDWNLTKWTPDFSFMNGHVEFCAGMCQDPYNTDSVLISFGFQDNCAFILQTPKQIVWDFLEGRL